MLDKNYIRFIERHGYISDKGKHVYGTAALLHYLSFMNQPLSSIDPKKIELGRKFVLLNLSQLHNGCEILT